MFAKIIAVVFLVSLAIIGLFGFLSIRDEEKRVAASFKQKQEEEQRILEEEKEKDARYNLVINCPDCLGNGESVWKEYCHFEKLSEDYSGPHYPPDEWDKVGSIEYSHGREYFRRRSCPFCEGEGIAYAYFEMKSKTCTLCKGAKSIETKEKAKVGVKTVTRPCGQCGASGETKVEYVHVQRLQPYKDKHNYFEKYHSVQLDGMNRPFYRKSEPRFREETTNGKVGNTGDKRTLARYYRPLRK